MSTPQFVLGRCAAHPNWADHTYSLACHDWRQLSVIAAPLEPTAEGAKKFLVTWPGTLKYSACDMWLVEVCEFAEAYAAAVSKNLQEELHTLKNNAVWDAPNGCTFYQSTLRYKSRILELEKEIAALRETKPNG